MLWCDASSTYDLIYIYIYIFSIYIYIFLARWLKILYREFCPTPTVLEHTLTILLSNFLLCRYTLPYQHKRQDGTKVSTHDWPDIYEYIYSLVIICNHNM